MLAGFYTIASGMMVQQKKLEVQGNNLINSQTPGFHAQRVVASAFQQELTTRMEAEATEQIGPHNAMTIVENVSTLFTSENFKQTDRDMDVAINGTGYFAIPGANDITYLTRNGGFDVDEQGYLVLPNVGRVLGADRNTIHVENTDFSIDSDGIIRDTKAQEVGQLAAVLPPEGVKMTQYQNGLFGVPSNTQLQAQEGTAFVQKSLELSNVDYNREMTMLLEAQKGFQSCSSALQLIDQINQKAASSIASITG